MVEVQSPINNNRLKDLNHLMGEDWLAYDLVWDA